MCIRDSCQGLIEDLDVTCFANRSQDIPNDVCVEATSQFGYGCDRGLPTQEASVWDLRLHSNAKQILQVPLH